MSPLLLFVLASVSLSSVLGALNCQPGWAFVELDSLGCIKVDIETRTWIDAVDFCHQENVIDADSGPRLFEATSIDDFNVLKRNLEDLANYQVEPLDYWLSGNDLYQENTWKWLSGTAVPSDLFVTGSPVPADNQHNCMSLLYDAGYRAIAQWCGVSLATAICQYFPSEV